MMGDDDNKNDSRRRLEDVSFIWLLPNLLTIASLVCGMTAIRYALDNRFEGAVLLVLLAAVLDGLDGRMARLLKSSSDFGAQLDSLSDLVVFGVVPAVVMYLFASHEHTRIIWMACLFYTICCALRLARFNSELHSPTPDWAANYFTGVPTPPAAILVMLPVMASFQFDVLAKMTTSVLAVWMAIIGVLAISTIPVFSGKKLKFSQMIALPALAIFALSLTAVIAWPWKTLIVIGFLYLLAIPISVVQFFRDKARKGNSKN
jgi:CDP-diacylglycerol--serine O-phosphatidyltransferase